MKPLCRKDTDTATQRRGYSAGVPAALCVRCSRPAVSGRDRGLAAKYSSAPARGSQTNTAAQRRGYSGHWNWPVKNLEQLGFYRKT